MAPRRGVRVVAMSDRILASMPDVAPWIPLGSLRLIANRRVAPAQAAPAEAFSSVQPERSSLVNGWQPLGVVIASGGFRMTAGGE
jgi:hypothetical protein